MAKENKENIPNAQQPPNSTLPVGGAGVTDAAPNAPAQTAELEAREAAVREREQEVTRRETEIGIKAEMLERRKASLNAQQNTESATEPRRVEVLVDNLGPNLLTRGTITDDEKIVALLDTARGHTLVREVKANC